MRGRRRVVVAGLIAWAVLMGASQNAAACSCSIPSRTFEEASATADLAFEGRIVRRWPALVFSHAFSTASVILTESYDFEVTRPIRGDFTTPPRLLFGYSNCDMAFDEGVEYQVVAYRVRAISDRYAASICSPNQAVTRHPGPWMEPPAETPTHPLRQAARFATAVVFGSMSTPLDILRNPWHQRGAALAALLYPAIWISLLTIAFQALRRGWTRRRLVLALLHVATIPWLAYTLARTDWMFDRVVR